MSIAHIPRFQRRAMDFSCPLPVTMLTSCSNLKLAHYRSAEMAAEGFSCRIDRNTSSCHYSHCRTATAGSDLVQSGRPIFDDFFQHLWPYIGNNTANVVFQMVKRLWLIRIDQ
ncbi:hypothetical protein TNCV_621831 [Trichonephila clavipes]|nr:hypothetical protein TNCV_621831 [Trichonephila clavipes]